MVINALTDKDKGHIPYRDSKLTRLLQESLGGNSQTSLILACSMCTYNDKETVDTLRFGISFFSLTFYNRKGNRAKTIKNTPIINAERSAKELTILLNAAEKKVQEQEELIKSLQQQLGGGAVILKQAAPSVSTGKLYQRTI
jgi:kinesin family protein 5